MRTDRMWRFRRSNLFFAAATALTGCRYNAELHRVTQERQLYDDLCARGSNVWRMYYQGTDTAFHRFLVNDMDRWAHVRIPAAQIRVIDPLPVVGSDSSFFGHYCVDPCDDWKRVPGPCWLGPGRQ